MYWFSWSSLTFIHIFFKILRHFHNYCFEVFELYSAELLFIKVMCNRGIAVLIIRVHGFVLGSGTCSFDMCGVS